MPPEKINTRGKILEKMDKNWNGLAIKDFIKDKNFKISERTLRETLDDLVKEGRVSKETQKRTQDRRSNTIYKYVA